MFSKLGPMELVIILLIVVLLFGARRIPEIAKGLGKGIREFKGAINPDAPEAGDDAKSPKKPEITDGAPKT